jgi:ubiquinone/menaquinone biosynthesis C-methylase UbiE
MDGTARYTPPSMSDAERPSPSGPLEVNASRGVDKRQLWEDRYAKHQLSEFFWYEPGTPAELRALLEEGSSDVPRPRGGALDLGCGPGETTTFMASHLAPVVGLDIAHAAVAPALTRARREGSAAAFIVGRAPVLPFRDGSFGLVFDRGCLQSIPRPDWRRYFAEVDRVLAPGGILQLYCSRVARPKLMTKRGLARRARKLLGQAQDHSLVDTLRHVLPQRLAVIELAERPSFTTRAGETREQVYGLFTKTIGPQ